VSFKLIALSFNPDKEAEIFFEKFHWDEKFFILYILRKLNIFIISPNLASHSKSLQSFVQLVSIKAKIVEVGMEEMRNIRKILYFQGFHNRIE
jgi:hypothetical protein